MSWNIEDNRKGFLNLKSKLGLDHVVLSTTQISPKNQNDHNGEATDAKH